MRSLEVEMLEREIMCLVSGALDLVSPVVVICCPSFPGCFPESRDYLCWQGSTGMSMSSAEGEIDIVL